jgi:polyisoprenoid-binding protein YceI
MTKATKAIGIFLVVVLSWISMPLMASDSASTFELKLLENSKLWLEGDSSIHAFESFAEELNLNSEVSLKANASVADSVTATASLEDQAAVSSLTLTIPIKEMKSPTPGLSKQMHKTLKYKEHPNIVFSLGNYSVAPNPTNSALYVINVKGTVSLAGAAKELELSMQGKPANDHVVVSGEAELLMTDFGIEPPTLMFGKIKVVDEIIIKWELALGLTARERRMNIPE